MPRHHQPTEVRLTKRQERWLKQYLEDAKAENISGDSWGSDWAACHGEGRSTSSITFHIGTRRESHGQQRYITAIVASLYSDTQVVVITQDGRTTLMYWNDKPDMTTVLNFYKRQILAGKGSTADFNDDDHDGNGGQGGGDGSSGSKSGKYQEPPWKKEVKLDRYGGYYFIDEEGEYMACDQQGNVLVYDDLKKGVRFYISKYFYRRRCSPRVVQKGSGKATVIETTTNRVHACRLAGKRIKHESRWLRTRSNTQRLPNVSSASSSQGSSRSSTVTATYIMVNGKKMVRRPDGKLVSVA